MWEQFFFKVKGMIKNVCIYIKKESVYIHTYK